MATPKKTARKAGKAATLPVDVFDAIAQGREAEWRAAQKNQQNQPPAHTLQAPEAIESIAELPTQRQVMRLACAMVAQELRAGIETASGDGWCEEFNDCVLAAELALGAVERLNAALPMDLEGFMREWYRVGGVLRLTADAFPDKSRAAWRYINGVAGEIGALYGMVECARPE